MLYKFSGTLRVNKNVKCRVHGVAAPRSPTKFRVIVAAQSALSEHGGRNGFI